MAEAECHLAVVERHVGIDARVVHHEERDVGTHEAGVLVDRDVLILPLVHERGGLEHLLLVPGDHALGVDIVALGVGPRLTADTGHRHLPVVGEGLGGIRRLRPADVHDQVVDLPIVVFVPDMVHRGQAEVFVHTTVTGDVVVADRTEQDLADDRTAGGVHAEHGRPTGEDVEIVADVFGSGIAAAGRTADARKARQQVRVAGNTGERIGEQVPGIETRQPVGDEDMIGQFRLDAGGRRIEIEDLAAAIPNAEIGDGVVPGEVGPAGRDDVLPQFIERRQRVLRQRHRAVGIASLPGLIEDGAVEQPDAGGVLAGDRIDHPLAEQIRRGVVGAIGLALIDVRGGVLLILGVRRTDDVVRRAIETVGTGAGDVVGGAELTVRPGRLRVGDGRPRDRDARHAVGRVVERVGRGKVDVDLAGLAVRQVAALADLVEAMVEELSEQVEDARHRRITGQRVQIADEVFLEVEAVRIRVASLVKAADLRQAGVQIGDLIDEVVGDQRIAADLIGPCHRGFRCDRLGNHPRRAVVDRREGIGIGREQIDAAGHVVAVVGIAEPGERPERGAPAGLIGGRDVVEQARNVADAERLGGASGGVSKVRPVDDLGQEVRPARLQQVERADLAELDDRLRIRVGIAVDGGAVGLVADGPNDRHPDLILEEGLVVGGDHEILDDRRVEGCGKRERRLDGRGEATVVHEVVGDRRIAVEVCTRRDRPGAVAAVHDRARGRLDVANEHDRAVGVAEAGGELGRSDEVSLVLDAGGEHRGRAGQRDGVVRADDGERGVGPGELAAVGHEDRERLGDLLPGLEGIGRGPRVVERVGETVGGRVEDGGAVGAAKRVGAGRGSLPAVRKEPVGRVHSRGFHVRLRDLDRRGRNAGHAVVDAAGLLHRRGSLRSERNARRRVRGVEGECARDGRHGRLGVDEVVAQRRVAHVGRPRRDLVVARWKHRDGVHDARRRAGHVLDRDRVAFGIGVTLDEVVLQDDQVGVRVAVVNDARRAGEQRRVVRSQNGDRGRGRGRGHAVGHLERDLLAHLLARGEGLRNGERVVERVAEHAGRGGEHDASVGRGLRVGRSGVRGSPAGGREICGVEQGGAIDVALCESDRRGRRSGHVVAGLDRIIRGGRRGDGRGVVRAHDRERATGLGCGGAVGHLDREAVAHLLALCEGFGGGLGIVEGIHDHARRRRQRGGAVGADLLVVHAGGGPAEGREARGVVAGGAIDIGLRDLHRGGGHAGRAEALLDDGGRSGSGSDGRRVVRADDREHGGGVCGHAEERRPEGEVVVDLLALGKGVGRCLGVVELVADDIGSHGQNDDAIAAILGVSQAGIGRSPAVGSEPGRVVVATPRHLDRRAGNTRLVVASLHEAIRCGCSRERSAVGAALNRECHSPRGGLGRQRRAVVLGVDGDRILHGRTGCEIFGCGPGVVEHVAHDAGRGREREVAVGAGLRVGGTRIVGGPAGGGHGGGVVTGGAVYVSQRERDRRIARAGVARGGLDQRSRRIRSGDRRGVVDSREREGLAEARGRRSRCRHLPTQRAADGSWILRCRVILDGPEQHLGRSGGGGTGGLADTVASEGEGVDTRRGHRVAPLVSGKRTAGKPERARRRGGRRHGDAICDRRAAEVQGTGPRAGHGDPVGRRRRGERDHHGLDIFSATAGDRDRGLQVDRGSVFRVGRRGGGIRDRGKLDGH